MSDQKEKYFDLVTNGIGYLSRVRDVRVSEGEGTFPCLTIAAIRGKSDDVKYTHFECTVAGKRALETIDLLRNFVKGNRKVLIGFTLSDIHSQGFIFQKGKHEGKPGVCLKARLIRLPWAKVDGNVVYDVRRQAVA